MVKVINGINPAGRGIEQVSQAYSSPVYAPDSTEKNSEIARTGAPVTDTVEVENSEASDEVGSPNMQALKNAFSLNQGFEAGMQPQFAINSSSGVCQGLEPGIQPGGVFKPPYEG